jgi:hypothetical protein
VQVKPPWKSRVRLLGHGSASGGCAAGGDATWWRAEVGGSHVAGNDGAVMVDGAGATAAPGTVDAPPPGREATPAWSWVRSQTRLLRCLSLGSHSESRSAAAPMPA